MQKNEMKLSEIETLSALKGKDNSSEPVLLNTLNSICCVLENPEHLKSLKIPHMGWDSIKLLRAHPVLKDVRADDEFYFVRP